MTMLQQKLLNLGNNTDEPLGILAVSESGTSFGLAEFLDMDKQTAIDTYGITGKSTPSNQGLL